jgi:hypothetical protein
MSEAGSSGSVPSGLHLYWYERKPCEEHAECWAQLCVSTHRLAFLRDELAAVNRIRNVDALLGRLAYHMENYLARVYELRERAAKLVATASQYKGKLNELKWRHTRELRVNALSNLVRTAASQYLELLALLDDDIDLRNRNTHETFLSLGFWDGNDVYDPLDVLVDLGREREAQQQFQRRLRREVNRKIREHEHKIGTIVAIAENLLEQLDFVARRSPGASDTGTH